MHLPIESQQNLRWLWWFWRVCLRKGDMIQPVAKATTRRLQKCQKCLQVSSASPSLWQSLPPTFTLIKHNIQLHTRYFYKQKHHTNILRMQWESIHNFWTAIIYIRFEVITMMIINITSIFCTQVVTHWRTSCFLSWRQKGSCQRHLWCVDTQFCFELTWFHTPQNFNLTVYTVRFVFRNFFHHYCE
jgi:hypothetical protein